MKLLWICNTQPGVVRSHIAGAYVGPVNWVDHVLEDLRREHRLRILCPGEGQAGAVDDHCSYATFGEKLPYVYQPELEGFFAAQIREFAPEVIHIWGVEYGHALAVAKAARAEGMLEHTVASIQGLCGIYAGHYAEGVPLRVQRGFTVRDFLRQDNICQQSRKFARRGALESRTFETLHHVIGRTDWDYACSRGRYPHLTYHFCNETLRGTFYEGQWSYEACQKHRIFASSRMYPIKGFHYVLEAAARLRRKYPDLTVAVTGDTYLDKGLKNALRREGYADYLRTMTRSLGLTDCVEFLGRLSDEEMKRQYLKANVFVMPSTIENSPNSLGEAMLLGTPSVASDVGGVRQLMQHPQEGFVYSTNAPYMFCHYIDRVFEMGSEAEAMGRSAALHARKTHDPQTNLQTLLEIYSSLL